MFTINTSRKIPCVFRRLGNFVVTPTVENIENFIREIKTTCSSVVPSMAVSAPPSSSRATGDSGDRIVWLKIKINAIQTVQIYLKRIFRWIK